MLPLDLPGIDVIKTSHDGPLFSIHAGCVGRPVGCVHCGSVSIVGHGQNNQEVMDLPHHGKFTCIHLIRKRYKCKDCSSTFFHPLDWINDGHRATTRFVDRITKVSLDRSFSDIAREYGVHEKTIRNIFYSKYADVIDTTRFESPEYLGIDEINIAGGVRCCITNLSVNAGIEFLPKRTLDTLRPYFHNMPGKENVKAVAMDMWRPYRQITKEFFPHAIIVIDKFHVLKMADMAVDTIRKKVRADCETKRTQLKLKKDRFIMRTRPYNMSELEKSQLAMWRQDFPLLGIAYDVKEEFFRIYDAKDRQEAILRFKTWKAGIPEAMLPYWEAIFVTYENWGDEIFNFFDLVQQRGSKLTNAYTECQNSITRAINSIGRGYSFDALRVKLLLAPKKEGIITSYRSIKRKKQQSDNHTISFSLATSFNDDYETIQIPERRMVTWGIDLENLGKWLDGQEYK